MATKKSTKAPKSKKNERMQVEEVPEQEDKETLNMEEQPPSDNEQEPNNEADENDEEQTDNEEQPKSDDEQHTERRTEKRSSEPVRYVRRDNSQTQRDRVKSVLQFGYREVLDEFKATYKADPPDGDTLFKLLIAQTHFAGQFAVCSVLKRTFQGSHGEVALPAVPTNEYSSFRGRGRGNFRGRGRFDDMNRGRGRASLPYKTQ